MVITSIVTCRNSASLRYLFYLKDQNLIFSFYFNMTNDSGVNTELLTKLARVAFRAPAFWETDLDLW